MKLSWRRYWNMLVNSGFRPMVFIHKVRIAALEDLHLELESHDYFHEARFVRSFIKTEPTP